MSIIGSFRAAPRRPFSALLRVALVFVLCLSVLRRPVRADCDSQQVWVPPTQTWVPPQDVWVPPSTIWVPASVVLVPETTVWEPEHVVWVEEQVVWVPEQVVWVPESTIWVEATTIWVAEQTIWVEESTVWVDGYTYWVDESWSWNEETQDWDYTPGHEEYVPGYQMTIPAHEEVIPAHEETIPAHEEVIPAHEETIPAHEETIPGHYEFVEGRWVVVPEHYEEVPAHEETVPGYWRTDPGYYQEVTPGYWQTVPVITWSAFNDITAESEVSGWTPDASTVPVGQNVTQTRVMNYTHTTGERSCAGDVRNIQTYTETVSETRTVPSTGSGGGGGGGGTNPPPPPPPNPSTTYSLTVIGGWGSATGLAPGTSREIWHSVPPANTHFAGWDIVGPGTMANSTTTSRGNITIGEGDVYARPIFVPAPTGATFWVDVNRDGIPDEVFQDGVGGYAAEVHARFELEPVFSTSFLTQANDWFNSFDSDHDGRIALGQYQSIWSSSLAFYDAVVPYNMHYATFDAKAGERYVICKGLGIGGFEWADLTEHTVTANSRITIPILEVAHHIYRFYVVRLGKPNDAVPLDLDNPHTWPQPYKNFFFNNNLDWDEFTLEELGDTDFLDLIYGGSLSHAQAERLVVPVFAFAGALPRVLPPQVQHRLGEITQKIFEALGGAVAIETIKALVEKLLTKKQDLPFSFVVYEMKNTITGQYYVGRTHGPGNHNLVLQRRFASHETNPIPHLRKSRAAGWTVIFFNSYHDMSNWDPGAWSAMRGREQSVMDAYKTYFPARPLVNIDRAVDVANGLGRVYHDSSRFYFPPEIHSFTGNPSLTGGVVPIVFRIIDYAWYPLNHGVRAP